MKYYFVSYCVNGMGTLIKNTVINTHPFEWIINNNEFKTLNRRSLISWQGITKDEYDLYNSHINK